MVVFITRYLTILMQPHPIGYPIDISIGSCFPSVCDEYSVKTILRKYYSRSTSIPLLEVKCPVPPTTLDTATIVGV